MRRTCTKGGQHGPATARHLIHIVVASALCLMLLGVLANRADAMLVFDQRVSWPGPGTYGANAVALSDDGLTMVVGYPDVAVTGTAAVGRAIVYQRARPGQTWEEVQRIVSPTVIANARFGRDVAISGDGSAILVRGLEDAAFYRRGGPSSWSEKKVINGGPNPGAGLNVISLSDDGTVAAIGDPSGSGTVAVWGYVGGAWSLVAPGLTMLSPGAGDALGTSVAVSGDGTTIVAGAPQYQAGVNALQGAIVVFNEAAGIWTVTQLITRTGGVAGDYFGCSVDVDATATTIFAGACAVADDAPGRRVTPGTGVVFTHPVALWIEQQQIAASTATSGLYGVLSSSGGRLLMTRDGTPTVYSRSLGVWSVEQSLTQSTAPPARVGPPVALAGTADAAAIASTSGTIGADVYADYLTPPRNVTGTPGDGTVDVSWDAPVATAGSTVDGYTVTASGGKTCTWTSGPLTCSIDGLVNGSAYTFTVTATNAAGDTSSASAASAAVTPRTLPGAPRNAGATTGDGSSVVSWQAPDSDGGAAVTAYTVTASPGGQTCTWSNGPLRCTLTGLTNGTTYTLIVSATNAAGTGPGATTTVTPTAPAPPPLTPTAVKWGKPTPARPLSARFKAAVDTTYAIRARLKKRVVTGRCAVSGGTAVCTVSLKAKGRWVVTITPRNAGVNGTPASKTVRV